MGDGKSERCLMLVELELDTCWDRHPCLSLIAPESHDLTTFQTPLGPHRLTALPIGWSNLVSIFQGHVTFILQDEHDTAPPFLDDVPILGPKTRYELPGGRL